jgi:streptomycin 6-kinase
MTELAAELQRASALIGEGRHDDALDLLRATLAPHDDPPPELRPLVIYGGGLVVQSSMYVGPNANEAKRLCEDLLDRYRDDPDPAVQQQLDWVRDLRSWVNSQT